MARVKVRQPAIPFPFPVISGTGTVSVSSSWQLTAGHWVPAKMTPVLIYPRPDSETEVWEICRRWPSQTAWSLPIGVRGGAWPFLYQIMDDGGIDGLTIGSVLPPDWLTNGLGDYGYLHFDAGDASIGDHEITVMVTDQDGTEVEVTFTLSIVDREETDYFVWSNPSTGNNGNDGSYSSPKQTAAGWYGSSLADATHAGKQAHFFAGTYNNTDIPDGPTVTQKRITSNKPRVLAAVEGETVIFDLNDDSYFTYLGTGIAGCAVKGIRFINPQTTEEGGRRQFLRLQDVSAETRYACFRNEFDGLGATAYASNSSVLMFADSGGTNGKYSIVSQNNFRRCTDMDFVLSYTLEDTLYEGNYSSDGYDGGQGFFFKGSNHNRISVRANRSLGTNAPLVFLSEFTGALKQNIEICWNSSRTPVDTPELYGSFGFGQNETAAQAGYGPIWVFRNNINSPQCLNAMGSGGGPFTWEKNAVQCDASHVATFGVEQYTGDRLTPVFTGNVAASSGILDGTTNLLIGAYRTANLGLIGCEVA